MGEELFTEKNITSWKPKYRNTVPEKRSDKVGVERLEYE